jgi:hypothetical protein
MVAPITGRDIAAAVGGLLATGAASVIGTLIVPRPVANWLTRWVDRIINGAFRLATRHVADYPRRDRVLAAQAATILIAQLAARPGRAARRPSRRGVLDVRQPAGRALPEGDRRPRGSRRRRRHADQRPRRRWPRPLPASRPL